MQKTGSTVSEMPFYSDPIAGGLATIFTHPFDTIKLIRQVQLGSNQKQSTEHVLQILHNMSKECVYLKFHQHV